MIDFGKVTKRELDLLLLQQAICPDCDGKGCEECKARGIVQLKQCSACKELKLPENFYGQKTKQSRCIPCYSAAYGASYRQALREATVA